MVQRPLDLDTACSLATLQEEVGEGFRHEWFSYEPPPASQSAKPGVPMPLPPPPPRAQALAPHNLEDKQGVEAARSGSNSLSSNNKVAALKAWCKARGREHTCPPSVQLHVLEELLDVFDFNTSDDKDNNLSETETVMAISCNAASGGNTPEVLQLQAWLQGREIFLLIDSGSTTSFVSQTLAESLRGLQPLKQSIRVKVANGAELKCSQELPQCKWVVQGHEFVTSFKGLPLG